jgi:hypothetical protein
MANRLSGEMTRATKKAVVDIDPRSALIDLNVQDLTGSSIQGGDDLIRCRNALGLKQEPALDDQILKSHQLYFNARVRHELDLVDPSGRGTRGRCPRDLAAVGAQCDGALQLLHAFIAPAARAVKAARREMGLSAT